VNTRPPLLDRLRRQERLVGVLLRMPSETLVEMAGLAGLDFVILDTEHGPGDQLALGHHIMAADATGIDVIVRVGHTDEILRALDLGAVGILAPHVSSRDQAQDVVRRATYPPKGERGFATYTRAGRHGLADASAHLAAANDHLVLLAMIEDRAGVADAADIASVEGVDGILVGPADLAVSLGEPGRTGAPAVVAATRSVHQAAVAAHKAVVTIVADPDGAAKAFAEGADVVILNTTAALGSLFADLASSRSVQPGTVGPAQEQGLRRRPREPLVLLPGMLGGLESWSAVADGLLDVARPQICRIDLDDTISGMAESVLAEAPERFALAGHSLGAIVALEVVARAPRRVTRLALVNASARAASAEQMAAWDNQRTRVEEGHFADVAREHGAAAAADANGDSFAEQLEKGADRVGPAGFLRQLRAQGTRPDLRPTLDDITVKTLVMSGACDEICPPRRQEELAAGIRDAHHVTVAGGGHHLPLERPRDVIEAMRQWLAAP
jgi:4-hydroxy-2-oxoheptanedioate aldolase